MRRGVPLLLSMLLACGASAAAGAGSGDISPAERLVFLDSHLEGVHPPAVLHYSLEASGPESVAKGDQLDLTLQAKDKGGCCAVSAEEHGGHAFGFLPPVSEATANPVILYFLERDIRQMQSMTGGQSNYFRHLIRLSLADDATVKATKVVYRGRRLPAEEVSIAPYTHDPRIQQFGALAGKTYVFVIARDAPGEVVQLKTTVAADSKSPGAETALTLFDSAAVQADGGSVKGGH